MFSQLLYVLRPVLIIRLQYSVSVARQDPVWPNFEQRIGGGVVLKALEIRRCAEIARGKTAVQDRFLSKKFQNGEVSSSEEKSLQVSKRLRRGSSAPIYLTVLAVLLVFCAGMSHATFESVWCDYDYYCELRANPGAGSGRQCVHESDFGASF